MRHLWFKNCYVQPILKSIKVDTIRRQTSRLPKMNEIVALSVGPRKPFAIVKIINIEIIDFDNPSLCRDRKKTLQKLYPDYEGPLIRLSFVLKSTC